MSVLGRLRQWLRPRPVSQLEPGARRSLEPGARSPEPEPEPPPGTDAFWARIDALVDQGRSRLASELLDKAAVWPGTDQAGWKDLVRRRAVELRRESGELRLAVAHLEALTQSSAHAAFAHFWLGELFRSEGDLAQALCHFEAVLALDVTYPRARERVLALSQERGLHPVPAALDETLTGAFHRSEQGAGRYRLVRMLGRGSSGAVMLARDEELEREVAMKLLHPQFNAAACAQARGRFFDEARLAASLRHPNIVAVLDLDAGQHRIIMELAKGGSLRQRLRAGPLPPLEALERHVEILSALRAIHRQGIVHRDLKPGNLLFRQSPAGEILLGDFGIAHLSHASPTGRAERAAGTLGYMAPELRQGAKADGRADLYAAAMILYEMLVGTPPWGESKVMTESHTLTIPPSFAPDPDLLAPLSEHLGCLGKADPGQRPSTEEALALAARLHEAFLAQAELAEHRRDRERVQELCRLGPRTSV